MPLVDVEAAPFRAKPLEAADDRVRRAAQARRGARAGSTDRGHCIGATTDPASGQVHVVGSVVAQLSQGEGVQDGVRSENVRYAKVAGRGRRNLLFLVDTSGSMLSADRLAMVKGCVASLLQDAYLTRTRVAVVGFGGSRARLVLPFTSSAELAAMRVGQMKGGGTTPMLQAFAIASRLVDGVEGEPVDIVLLSDGRYDRVRGAPVDKMIRAFGAHCAGRGCRILLVHAGRGGKTSRARAMQLAKQLKAQYRQLDELRADALSEVVERLE